MALFPVRFEYLTGLAQPLFANARLSGSWDAQGRPSSTWTETAMEPFLAEDGCPAFRATAQLDDSQIGQPFRWGVYVDAPGRQRAWAMPIEINDPQSRERYATFMLEDKEGVVEVIAWPDTYRRHESVIQGGAPVVVAGALEASAERCQVIADEITPLAQARSEAIRQVHVRVPLDAMGRDGLSLLRQTLAAHPGPCEAFLHLVRSGESETVPALPSTLRVAASEQIVNAVEGILGTGVMTFR